MRVLGVDPGLGRCGWAVLERRGGRVAAAGYGTIHTDGEQVAPRLLELATRLRQVLAAHRPEALAIERLFFNANVRTAMTVGQASGVVLLLAAEHGLQVTAYTPPQVKQAVTGSGSAPKEQVGSMVKALLGLAEVPAPADTADALAVALCHLNHTGPAGPGPGGVRGGRDLGQADGTGGRSIGAASAADWLARAAPTSPGLPRRGPGNPKGVPREIGRGPGNPEGVPR
ncbi:MAG TPA: crossover junction endodeoxyribonuclease RuvC [Actinomycetota bacterium]|nr:crossover junction endodeoxyribonuclease RuvC [Actinomycetota bacterium]